MANKNAAKKQQAKRAARAVSQAKETAAEEVKVESVEATENVQPEKVSEPDTKAVEKEPKQAKTEEVKDAKAIKDQKKKKKEKKHRDIGRGFREMTSELKKVTWPSFSTVVKNTGIVLAVVIFFTAILFGFDSLLGWIYGLFTKNL